MPFRLILRCLLVFGVVGSVVGLFDSELLRLFIDSTRHGAIAVAITMVLAVIPLHFAVYLLVAPCLRDVRVWWQGRCRTPLLPRRGKGGSRFRLFFLLVSSAPVVSLLSVRDNALSPLGALVCIAGVIFAWRQWFRDAEINRAVAGWESRCS